MNKTPQEGYSNKGREMLTSSRTPEEQQFLKIIERLRGRLLTEQEENLAIEQAKALGELPQE
jgi:Ser/Thr protein kinase RdoA (MazF antagonist)